MPSLSAALISKAAFIMRKLNQNRKLTKPQTKQKKKCSIWLIWQIISLNTLFEEGTQGRVEQLHPAAGSNLSDV